MDGREVWIGIIEFYDRKSNLDLVSNQYQTELATMQLNRNYPGGALKFFQLFQSTYLDI